MRILLLGFGKMGKKILELAEARDHNVVHADNHLERGSIEDLANIDVALEFSQPDAAFDNIKFCITNSIPCVSGTTGWLNRKSEIEDLCSIKQGTFFYASNFSIGVNVFFRINSILAEIMEEFPEYDIHMKEIHHTEKIDSPSGTAITLAENVLNKISRKVGWQEDTQEKNLINIKSERQGQVPGTHSVTYHSSLDSINLTHEALTRESFAKGALTVAEWLPGKKGILSMDDFMPFKK